MKTIIKLFKWLFGRFLVKDVVYKTTGNIEHKRIGSVLNKPAIIEETIKVRADRSRKKIAIKKRQFNPGVRIMTHNERILYRHYPNLQKWYNHFKGIIPDKLPELNFKPK